MLSSKSPCRRYSTGKSPVRCMPVTPTWSSLACGSSTVIEVPTSSTSEKKSHRTSAMSGHRPVEMLGGDARLAPRHLPRGQRQLVARGVVPRANGVEVLAADDLAVAHQRHDQPPV